MKDNTTEEDGSTEEDVTPLPLTPIRASSTIMLIRTSVSLTSSKDASYSQILSNRVSSDVFAEAHRRLTQRQS